MSTMSIIAILATITFTLTTGVRERGKRAHAKAELAVLASALEQYKNAYGDYPQTGAFTPAGPVVSSAVAVTNSESKLFNALFGVLGPKMVPILDPNSGNPAFGKTFIEGAKFAFETLDGDGEVVYPESLGVEVANAFLDPWGRRYQYFYKDATQSPPNWTEVGFVLYTSGSDGKDLPPGSTGIVDYSESVNLDNIFANRD